MQLEKEKSLKRACARAQGGVKWIHLKVETITSPLREQSPTNEQLQQMEQQQQLWPRQAQVRQAKKNCLSQVQTNFNHPQVMKTIKYSWFNDHFAMLQLSVAVPKTETEKNNQTRTRNSHLSRNVNDGTDDVAVAVADGALKISDCR